MTSDSSNTETKTVAEFVEQNSSLRPIWEYNWKNDSFRQMPRTPMAISWSGIVLAAGLYPIVLTVFFWGYMFLAQGLDVFAEPIEVTLSIIISSVIGCIFAMAVTIIVSIPAYLLLQVFGWISGGVISGRAASGIYGGLTGFMTITGGGLMAISFSQHSDYDFEMLVFIIFPTLLAIVMGYAGAILAGYRKQNEGYPFFESLFVAERRFTIWLLMKLTTLVAVVAIVCKAAGDPGLAVGIAWTAYCVVQGLLLLCDHWLRYWIGRWKNAKAA